MELSAAQVIGGALAAASAAAAASVLGVYGTVIGAAVVSAVASVGGAVYTHSFRKGSQKIKQAHVVKTLRLRRPVPLGRAAVWSSGQETQRLSAVGGSEAASPTQRLIPADDYTARRLAEVEAPPTQPFAAAVGLAAAGSAAEPATDAPTQQLGGAPTEELAADAPTERLAADGDAPTEELAADGDMAAGQRPGWRQRLAGINPKAVALTGVAVLVLSLSAIVFVESLIGQPLSSALGDGDDKGGNSISRVVQGDRGSAGDEESPTPTASRTPTGAESTTSAPTPTTSSPEATQERSSTTRPSTSRTTERPATSTKPAPKLPTSTGSGAFDGGRDERLPAE